MSPICCSSVLRVVLRSCEFTTHFQFNIFTSVSVCKGHYFFPQKIIIQNALTEEMGSL